MREHIVSIILLAIALLSTSCGGSGNKNPLNKNGDPIIGSDFSDGNVVFPDGKPLFVAMIKLNTPALLNSASRGEDGSYKIDLDMKDQVLSEQENLEAELEAISPDIKVIYKYRMVLNALAVEAPQEFAEEISKLGADFIEADERFARPQAFTLQSASSSAGSLSQKNSMSFVGVDKVHALKVEDGNGRLVPVRGKGIKVGVIDTGIDYTHSMLGGTGSTDLFSSLNPNLENSHFPNKKVVGGMDFVGAKYTPGAHIYTNRIPKPDMNPLDQGGHGTHVAGTVAGLGDGENTYNGAAPDADLYALKVFGDGGGGTSDTVVIAALEYAVDPNGDFSLDDKLDVVNLSLGGGYGKPHNLYAKAIGNLVKGGVVTVASAGNAGPISNIVGAPSTADAAISVAASIDNMDHNSKFEAVRFKTKENPSLLVEVIQGNISIPVGELESPVGGKLVAIGVAASDLSDDVKALVKGHIALIDRGEVSFVDKLARAVDAGAIGVVVANNQDGDPIRMGGEGEFKIPAVMITKALGAALKTEMETGEVKIDFKTSELIEKPELIDTLTSFSSQGPRDLDAAIKPEITAPGLAIISAEMGSGSSGVKLGGTSMSSPHIAGIVALVLQYQKNVAAEDIKSLIVNSSKLISDEKGVIYPISRQGAGRIDAFRAVTSDVALSKSTVSLGRHAVERRLNLKESFSIKNLSDEAVSYRLSVKSGKGITVSLSSKKINLEPGDEADIDLKIRLTSLEEEVFEADAFIQIKKGKEVVGNIPVLAVVSKSTRIQVKSLDESSETVKLSLANSGRHDGSALIFNLLGEDSRKPATTDTSLSVACDLESAGYRLVSREVEGEAQQVLQVSVKTYNPVSDWNACDINLELDLDQDGLADKELIGSDPETFPGFEEDGRFAGSGLSTMLYDSNTLSNLIEVHATELAKQQEEPVLNYVPALQGLFAMTSFNHSTLAILEVPVEALGATIDVVGLKVSVSYNGGDVVERNDELTETNQDWIGISLLSEGQPYSKIPEEVAVLAKNGAAVDIAKNAGEGDLIAYFPRNKFTKDLIGKDNQSQVLKTERAEISLP